ncbi:MAG TPA: NADH-quinone oxidoreductase subunit L [Saprospiraceae bacterium]|nr:NADH-quinone oxidoreductase subunit L [Saprospiraceae bacterium]
MNIAEILWLIPFFPLAGFLILAFFGKKIQRSLVPGIGSGVIGISALITIVAGISFMNNSEPGAVIEQHLWTWFRIGDFHPEITLHLDGLSLIFIFVITFVGFLIHVFSSEYMKHDDGYSRFFAYMNLFVCSMLILVLANDLLLLYLGWEGVGLCSFLLIGFYYGDTKDAEKNALAARKSFLVTRIGDTSMILGFFLLVKTFNTLNISEILQAAPSVWETDSTTAIWAAALLLGGALGKSAQLPLQTWLPDAMAGPSPVSALIHAATMVTAGVYLLTRTYVLFELAPTVQMAVAIIGAATLFIASCSALAQDDIKRVLAYSTISQIGYMFLACGVGAWSAAIFHFMIHAFFKALLFLGAGAVILALHHEQNMFKMGGLRKKLPVVFWTFLFGSAALASIPLITAGFYSKDAILWYSFAGEKGSIWLWLAGVVSAFLTALYTFRMVFLTFFGEQKTEVSHQPGLAIKVPLIILGILSLVAGFIELPHNFGHFAPFSEFLDKVLSPVKLVASPAIGEGILQLVAGGLALMGLFLAWRMYGKANATQQQFGSPAAGGTFNFFYNGWNFDKLYDILFVKPLVWLSRIDEKDFVDSIYKGIGRLNIEMNGALSRTQNGKLRYYLLGLGLGAMIVLTLILVK